MNIPSWLDVKDIGPGDDWQHTIDAALDAAPALVLVLSPDSMKSENVSKEWKRAYNQGKRIVLVRFRRAHVPYELSDCEVVDFRGRFGAAIYRLVEVLRTPSANDYGIGPKSLPHIQWPMPPWVTTTTLMLTVLMFFLFATGNYDTVSVVENKIERWSTLTFSLIGLGLFVWFFLVAFVRRSFGLKRLVFLFAFFALSIGYLLLQHMAGTAMPQIFPKNNWWMWVVRSNPLSAFSLFMIAITGLTIVIIMRPRDILHWLPTGKAWNSYRTRHTTIAPVQKLGNQSMLSNLKRFALMYDPVDEPAAVRLRQELTNGGASEASERAEDVVSVVLLTNRTSIEWIGSHINEVNSPLLPVVGTSIGLPWRLNWLWRRQWTDFRSWRLGDADALNYLPAVPESLVRLRLPVVVNLAHNILCALASLSLLTAGGVIDNLPEESQSLPLNYWKGMLALIPSLLWAFIARRWLFRTIGASAFYRWFTVNWVITLILVIPNLYTIAIANDAFLRLLPAVLFLVTVPMWLRKWLKDQSFWLPSQGLPKGKYVQRLAPKRNWRTLLLVVLYTLLWGILFYNE